MCTLKTVSMSDMCNKRERGYFSLVSFKLSKRTTMQKYSDIGWCCSVNKSFLTLSDHMDCHTPGPAVLHYLLGLLKFISTELVMLFTHLILCSPLLCPLVFPIMRIFSSQPALLIRWPVYCRFSCSISPSNEYSGLISFRIYSFDLLAVQGTLKRFL